MLTSFASFPAFIIFFRYSIEYFALIFAGLWLCIFVSSLLLISMFALLRSPSAEIVSLSGSAAKVTLSATMSASAIASFSTVLLVLITIGKLRFGILCSFSSISINGRLNVLIVPPFSCICSLFSPDNSSVSMSLAPTLLRICLKFARLIAISCSFSTSYSVKLLDNSLNMTIATFAGSMATSSSPSLVILNLASLTRSEITAMLSFSNVGSANTSLILLPPLRKFVHSVFKCFIVME